MAVQIQIRRDTLANWTSANPILAVGELGYVTDTDAFKVASVIVFGGVKVNLPVRELYSKLPSPVGVPVTALKSSNPSLVLARIYSEVGAVENKNKEQESVKQEYKLPPIEDKTIWLNFTPTERAMYNAYLANPNNSEFSVYLRQLCCHPNLAYETKEFLSQCKTLEDIEKMMVIHYQKEVEKANKKVVYIQKKYYQLLLPHLYYILFLIYYFLCLTSILWNIFDIQIIQKVYFHSVLFFHQHYIYLASYMY